MRESSNCQAILEEGLEKRREEDLLARQDDLVALLQERFGSISPEVETKIRMTTDLAKLQTAIRRVVHITAPDELPL